MEQQLFVLKYRISYFWHWLHSHPVLNTTTKHSYKFRLYNTSRCNHYQTKMRWAVITLGLIDRYLQAICTILLTAVQVYLHWMEYFGSCYRDKKRHSATNHLVWETESYAGKLRNKAFNFARFMFWQINVETSTTRKDDSVITNSKLIVETFFKFKI